MLSLEHHIFENKRWRRSSILNLLYPTFKIFLKNIFDYQEIAPPVNS